VSEAGALEGRSWKLTHLTGVRVPSVPAPREPALEFDAATRRVSGCGGCNRIGGSYEVTGDRLRIGPLASTMMYCEETMELEQRFLTALGSVRRWRVAGPQLLLADEQGRTLAELEAGER
jgi:copper homeostasis protein (lipoprotein)